MVQVVLTTAAEKVIRRNPGRVITTKAVVEAVTSATTITVVAAKVAATRRNLGKVAKVVEAVTRIAKVEAVAIGTAITKVAVMAEEVVATTRTVSSPLPPI